MRPACALIGALLLVARESNTHSNGVDQIVAGNQNRRSPRRIRPSADQNSEASAKLDWFNQSIGALSLVTIKSNTYSDRIDEIVAN